MSVTSITDSASTAGVRQLRHADAAAERVHQIWLAQRAELLREATERAAELLWEAAERAAELLWEAAERAAELLWEAAERAGELGWEATLLLTGPPALEGSALLSELLVGDHGRERSESAPERGPDWLVSELTLQLAEQPLRREAAEWLGVLSREAERLGVLSVQLTESLEQELRGHETWLTIVRGRIRHHVKAPFIAYEACRVCEGRPNVPRSARSASLS